MSRFGRLFTYMCLFGFTAWAQAQSIPLQNLDNDDYRRLVGDFSANSNHTSVSGASSLGEIFGFELGLVAGATSTPEINKLAKEVDPGSSVAHLPHGELLGIVTVPFGISVELGLIPKIGTKDFKFSSFAFAGKWTFTDVLVELPVAMALKAQYSNANLQFDASPNGVPTHFKYDNSMTALTFFVSKDLMIFEPYAALGTVSSNGKMDVNGSTSVFANSSTSASARVNSTVFMLGTEVKLGLVKLGAEYARLFSTNSFTGKLSFYF